MPTISELVVKITGDTKGLTSSLTDSQKKLASFAVGATAATAAVVAVGKAVAKAVGEFASYGDMIDKASQKTGMSTDSFQEWKHVAELSGTSAETLTTSIGVMTRGLETNEETFRSLGVEIRNTDGSFKSTNQIFDETVNKLADMGESTERDRISLQLFGRGAQALNPIFNSGSASIAAMKKEAHDLGLVMKNETVKNAATLSDNVQNLKDAFTAAKNNIVAELAPAIISITKLLAEQIQKTIAAKEAREQLTRVERGEVLTATERVSALQGAREELKRITYEIKSLSIPAAEMEQILADRTKDIKLLIDSLEKQIAAEARWAEADRRGGEERRRIAEAAQREADAAAIRAEEAAQREAKRIEQEQAAIKATEARIAAEVRLKELISKGREELFEEMDEFDAKTIESDDKVVESKEANAKQLVAVNKTAANDIRTAWKKALDESAKQFKEWGEFAAEQGKTLVGTFADATMALGEALANGEDAWASMGKVALQALASVLEAIGYQLAALSVVHALALDVAGAIAAGVGSAAAFVGAGLIKGWSNQFAMGTDFAPGGRALVGERGPEVVNVPRGASVTPAHRTMTNEGGSGIVVNIHSPVALNPSEASAVMKQTMRELAFVGAL